MVPTAYCLVLFKSGNPEQGLLAALGCNYSSPDVCYSPVTCCVQTRDLEENWTSADQAAAFVAPSGCVIITRFLITRRWNERTEVWDDRTAEKTLLVPAPRGNPPNHQAPVKEHWHQKDGGTLLVIFLYIVLLFCHGPPGKRHVTKSHYFTHYAW